ncbi:arylamine N-acetyltransferase family protein [Hymenobacter metallicola]|uniref:Acetyltransferase n=1 Tax=Hymenobacter metallicola TaxID=2563114 RepID=A0A4Z0PZ93_9BACT|nr:arylamine N-acetyltransferase [Hymenobacter metallicola]TGE23110.1 acetyltransferase [Hymenobacter metallicola]
MPTLEPRWQRYLDRIQYAGPLATSLPVLRALQAAHLFHVPFENLDIHRGQPIHLTHSYEKVVEAGRGGFCYELNGVFYELLTALGFTARLISARVFSSATTFGPEFDHMAILVTLPEGEYLVDVGFGEFTQGPLANQLGLVQTDPRGHFVLEQYDATYRVVSKLSGEGQVPEYLFTTTARTLPDFAAMCRYHQTSPASHFTQKRLCSLATETGRVTISGTTLKITQGELVEERILPDEAEFNEALARYFNVRL